MVATTPELRWGATDDGASGTGVEPQSKASNASKLAQPTVKRAVIRTLTIPNGGCHVAPLVAPPPVVVSVR